MFARVLIIVAALFVAFPSLSQSARQARLSDGVVVRKLKEELPVKGEEVSKFLWSHFANKPEEERFRVVTTAQWKEKIQEFEKVLVAKAEAVSLDAESLRQCLIEVSNRLDSLPHLPVGAYATTQGDVAVWIIVIKWENDGSDIGGKKHAMPLGHIMVYALDARKRSLIRSVTCR